MKAGRDFKGDEIMKSENIVMLVMVVVLGGIAGGAYFSMEAKMDIPDAPVTGGLTERGLEVKADIVEREARGFVQYTGKFVEYTPLEC